MSNHVAGNVATKKMTIMASSALNMEPTSAVEGVEKLRAK
jgi:hypothetical protein